MKAVPSAELSNEALSWAVASVMYPERIVKVTPHYVTMTGPRVELETTKGSYRYLRLAPHANARQANPIIRRLNIRVLKDRDGGAFMATETGPTSSGAWFSGSTRLEAAMRCVVGNRAGLVTRVPNVCFQ